MVSSLIGACAFSVVIILSFLIILGLPLGELTMGGYLPLWFSHKTTRIILIVMAVYLSLNVLMNLASKSRKERLIMTPLSLIAAVCFWITVAQSW